MDRPHSLYSRFIMEQAKCNREEAAMVEAIMRITYGCLDGVPRARFIREGRQALKDYRTDPQAYEGLE